MQYRQERLRVGFCRMDFKLRTNAKYFSDTDLLADLRKAAKTLGKNAIGQREYLELGTFSCKPFINRFGSWNNALNKAGLEVAVSKTISNEQLFENLEKIWRHFGRQPFYSEIRKPFSEYSVDTYCRRFGGWLKACEAFIRYKQDDPEFVKLFKEKSTGKTRAISEKLRLQVFKRDNYACVICGKSPATHRGTTLHLDHKVPFSKDGDNSPENLRTLCDKCNLGKGNEVNL